MHFFIDESKLPAIDLNDLSNDEKENRFGPDLTTPTTKFNVTTKFQLSEDVKAYACQKGELVVQEYTDDKIGLVNIILKPATQLNIQGITVKYYVYRGIHRDSFFNYDSATGDYTLNPSGTNGESELMTEFWSRDAIKKTYQDQEAAENNVTSAYIAPTPLNLGYGSNNVLPITICESLHATRSIADIFSGNTIAEPFYLVTEGMWIGTFAQKDSNNNNIKIGFEIVLDSDFNLPDALSYYRASDRAITTGSLEGLELKKIKESILSFIDPAPFFGMHYKPDVGVFTSNQSSPRTLPSAVGQLGSLYTHIISKFATGNRIYLDIRSEKGMSYNFYDNYKVSGIDPNNIRLHDATEANAETYGKDGWPIHFFYDNIQATNTKNKLTLRLRIDGNVEPVLYIDINYYGSQDDVNGLQNFYSGSKISSVFPSTDNWTELITLYYPNDRTTNKENVACYIKATYFIGGTITTGTSRLKTQKYFDSAFCSLDMEEIGDSAIINGHVISKNVNLIKAPLATDGTGNFQFTAVSGAYWDTNRVLLYCKSNGIADIQHKRPRGNDVYDYYYGSGKIYENTYERKINLSNEEYTYNLRKQFDVICRQYERTGSTFKIVGINNYRLNGKNQLKEDLLLLGLTTTQYGTLKNLNTGFSTHHPRYIYLLPDGTMPLGDVSTENHRYYKYKVMVQGLAPSTSTPPTIAVYEVDSGIVVYSRDNQFFASEYFTADEVLTPGPSNLSASKQNRIEYHVYHDGNIKINDNIDLALLRKSKLKNENEVEDETAKFTGDKIQRIYYMYHTETTENQASEIISMLKEVVNNQDVALGFNFVMANKVKKEGTTITNLTGYNSFITYNGNRVDAEESYKHPTTGDIITRGSDMVKYTNLNQKIFLVYLIPPGTDTSSNSIVNSLEIFTANTNNLGMLLKNFETRRHYSLPLFFAIFLGTLAETETGTVIKFMGISYSDATCYPSKSHINGLGLDTFYIANDDAVYRNNPQVDYDLLWDETHYKIETKAEDDYTTDAKNEEDYDYAKALCKFGCSYMQIGKYKSKLETKLNAENNLKELFRKDDSGTMHANHLHVDMSKPKKNNIKNDFKVIPYSS
ncbi:MAG: hypothetical protein K9I02_01685 [Haliscomenobacter sp.]|nr:hypothetical protein [Haliscomenobacter sp.]